MNRSIVTVVVLLLPLLLGGCGGCEMLVCGEDRPEYTPDYGSGGSDDGLDVGSVTFGIFQIFSATGVRAEIGPMVETGLFDRTAREINVEGSPVFFIEYDDIEDAQEVAASIAADGRMVGDKPVPKTGATSGMPHWYRSDKVIAFYFGERASTLEALAQAFDAPFIAGAQ